MGFDAGMPCRIHGTIVRIIVPHAPAWECSSGRSASDLERTARHKCVTRSVTKGIPTQSVGTIITLLGPTMSQAIRQRGGFSQLRLIKQSGFVSHQLILFDIEAF